MSGSPLLNKTIKTMGRPTLQEERYNKKRHREFVALVDKLMAERCCTKADIAKACGIISNNFISYYTGGKNISSRTLERVKNISAGSAITLNERLQKLEESDEEIKKLLAIANDNLRLIPEIEQLLACLRYETKNLVRSLENAVKNNDKEL